MIVSRKQGLFTGCLLITWLLLPVLTVYAGTVEYSYDRLNRVVRAEYGDGTMFEYSYDTIGNRVTATTTTAAATPTPEPTATPTPTGEQSPYGGSPWIIPGQIEAEDYDVGGEGVAYHDTSSGNEGGAYRSDDVDIAGASDTGGGYMIGWIISGEWLEYTVNVSSPGRYDVDLRVSSQSSEGTCHLEFDGVDKTGPISIPNTGGWQTWTTVTVRGILLEAGPQIMRLAMDVSPFNVNWVNFTDSSTPTPMPTPTATSVVPEPSTLLLVGLGVFGGLWVVIRRRKRSQD